MQLGRRPLRSSLDQWGRLVAVVVAAVVVAVHLAVGEAVVVHSTNTCLTTGEPPFSHLPLEELSYPLK